MSKISVFVRNGKEGISHTVSGNLNTMGKLVDAASAAENMGRRSDEFGTPENRKRLRGAARVRTNENGGSLTIELRPGLQLNPGYSHNIQASRQDDGSTHVHPTRQTDFVVKAGDGNTTVDIRSNSSRKPKTKAR